MATTRTVTLEELGVILEELTDKAPLALRKAMQVHAQDIIRTVTREHMSGQDLGIVTGTARRSMRHDVFSTGETIRIESGSPLAYVRAHEEGFSGKVQVRAHIRSLVALKRGRGGTVTKKSAKAYKRAIREGRATSSNVRAHTRQVNMRARAFLRKSLKEVEAKLPVRLGRALRHLASTGNVPTFSDIAGGAGA